VRAPALAASSPATDFGGLFLALSFFLLVSAFLLVGLLLSLGIRQRSAEIGTLLAIGFRPATVRRLLLGEAALLSAGGAIVGAGLAAAYAWLALLGLDTIWRGAVGGATLDLHLRPPIFLLGAASAFLVAQLAAWLTLRRQAEESPVELLAGRSGVEAHETRRRRVSATVAIVAALAALAAGIAATLASGPARPAASFAAGTLALLAALAACRFLLRPGPAGTEIAWRGAIGLAWSNATRRPARSLATVVLLACPCFLVIVVGASRKGLPGDPASRAAGTGGFALLGRSSLAIVPDRTDEEGGGFRLVDDPPSDVAVVPLRVREGDEASCLNLNRPQEPRLVGVDPDELARRRAFRFAQDIAAEGENPWRLLASAEEADVIPAIGDAAAVTWSLHLGLGDTLPYVDEAGRAFSVRIVGTLAGSILQGDLLVDERRFRERFPSETGFRMFLVDAPAERAPELAAAWMRERADEGLELVPTPERLAELHAIQNTYLLVFQMLGGLGLLLGSLGLGVVVLRNVEERRGELSVLVAVGFPARRVRRLLLAEHAFLLVAGACGGALAALVAIVPQLSQEASYAPLVAVPVILAGLLLAGALWVTLATRLALRRA